MHTTYLCLAVKKPFSPVIDVQDIDLIGALVGVYYIMDCASEILVIGLVSPSGWVL